MKQKAHRWNFFRAGGSTQVAIASGKDIENIDNLDAKLWAALSCPTSGLTLDNKTLELFDSNGDGRIRREEIIAACKWICANLNDTNLLLKSSESLPLANINVSSVEGKSLLNSAQEVLANLGKSSSDSISVADFADESKIFAQTAFNADGIITKISCGNDEQLASVLETVLSVSEPKKDRSGLDGIDTVDIEKFFTDASEYILWTNRPTQDTSILFLQDDTAAAFKALSAVEVQINDWFARSKIVAYNADMQSAMDSQVDEKLVKAYSDLDFEQLKKLPIVKISSTGVIDLSSGVNPAWESECLEFRTLVLDKLLGSPKFTVSEWIDILAKFAPYKNWCASKPNVKVSSLDFVKLCEISTPENKRKLLDLIEQDALLKDKVQSIASVEKLVRFNRDLFKLLKNFISFQDFYTIGSSAIFQYGNLYIDGRMCELCIKVDNVANHSKMSPLAYGYLVYCVCSRKGASDINIVAMITSGDSDNIIVGRNGIFYDYLGNEWDATITKVVDNPIGVAQAFFSPYKRLVKWISEQISKRASAADKAAVANVTDGKVIQQKKDGKMDIGTIAAIGVAVGGITTMFGMVVDAIFGLGYWLPLGILGVVLAISLPSMFIASLKLRMRNLAPILDGNGWAVNAKAAVCMTFGRHLTKMAHLPKGARVSTISGFEKNRNILGKVVLVAIMTTIIACGFYCWHKSTTPKQSIVECKTDASKCNLPKASSAKPVEAKSGK